LARNQNNVSE